MSKTQLAGGGNISRFNAEYILKVLYEYDDLLGGRLREEEAEREKADKFYVEQAEISKIFNEVKKIQAQRNKIKLEEGRCHKQMTLDTDINENIGTADKRVEDLNKLLREQAKESRPKEEIKRKEDVIESLKKISKNLKEREQEAKKIKSVKDLAKEAGVDIKTIDLANVKRAEQRALSSDEKDFLEKVEREKEEIDSIMGEAEKEMDTLISGIDLINENLETQNKQVKRLGQMTDKLYSNLESSNKKLKTVVGRFRSATNVSMDIGLIVLLLVMLGVLFKVLKSNGSSATSTTATTSKTTLL